DIKVRYKQTVLGAAWAILQPTLTMAVFTVVLGRLARLPSGGIPYPLFVFTGLLLWSFFAATVTRAGNSVVDSERLITKVYFPRLSVPFAAIGTAVIDFIVAFGVLVLLMLAYGVPPGWSVLLTPILLLLTLLTALGVGTLLAALNVAYRDIRHII